MEKVALLLLVACCSLVGFVNGDCACSQTYCTCSSQLPQPFRKQAVVNITYSSDMIQVVQSYGGMSINSFSYPNNDAATCVATEELGWCIVFFNLTTGNNWAVGSVVSTFAHDQEYYNVNQGLFKLHESDSAVVVPRPAIHASSADICSGLCGRTGCTCPAQSGCSCCPAGAAPSDSCVLLDGRRQILFLQASVQFGGQFWLLSTSQVQHPQVVCTLNSHQPGVVCLSLPGVSFGSSGISGAAYVVYIMHERPTPFYAGNFVLSE